MRVLQINSTCGDGSTGKIVVDIYDMLVKTGNSGLVAFGRGEGAENVSSYKIGSNLSVKVHGILSRITDRQGFYSCSATKKLIVKIKEFNPDIIHLHNIHGYYLNAPLLFNYLAECNKPIVWTLHDCWAFTGHCSYFSYAGCEGWQNGCGSCPQKGEYPASYVFDNSGKNYLNKKSIFNSVEKLQLVTPSDWLQRVVKKSFLGEFPVQTIYNGIDLEVFRPRESDFREKFNLKGKKIILGVANIWERRKGLQDFCALRKILPEEYKIVLVGLSKEQIQRLPEGILGISRTSSAEQLAEIYSAADVYVNTSVEETMGLTTLEALACGTPAVVYNATAVPEVVNESCGKIVSAGDVSAIAEAVKNIYFEPEACIERAEEFEKNRQYKKYLNLYNQLI